MASAIPTTDAQGNKSLGELTTTDSGEDAPGLGQNTNSQDQTSASTSSEKPVPGFSAPAITVPKGGGSLKSMGEKLDINPSSGSCTFSVPFSVTAGRNDITPEVSLSYSSTSGNGPFGLGWSLSLPSITRKTSKGLPTYVDDAESDVFLFAGLEDLVPKFREPLAAKEVVYTEKVRDGYRVREYWPRTEKSFHRIERWTRVDDASQSHWRTVSTANVTDIYGIDHNSRIMENGSSRIFSWLLALRFDDRGNAMRLTYKQEDETGVDVHQAHEMLRSTASRTANRYVKSIKYGNTKPYNAGDMLIEGPPSENWLFQVIFDYGDHQGPSPVSYSTSPWQVRPDPFSTYSAGFEIRTYRLCRRVLLFHHFPEELGIPDYLVKSMHLHYDEQPSMSVLAKITQAGHAWDPGAKPPGYVSRHLPALELKYSRAALMDSLWGYVEAVDAPNLPVGLSSPYRWLDLDGTGKPGVLYTHDGAWHYIQNTSTYQASYHEPAEGVAKVSFAPARQLLRIPAADSTDADSALLDVNGNGKLDLVRSSAVDHGFYERSPEDVDGWSEFRPFTSWPIQGSQKNNNLRYLDLTGDGLADIAITEGDSILWYPSLGAKGYDVGVRSFTGATEDEGPRLLFQDGLETLYLADMSGDGLVDIVRIRDSSVCYWPNLGYGRFAAKVSMANAPLLARGGRFSPARVKLADLDGSGTTDILYFPETGDLEVYLNHCGNAFGEGQVVSCPPLDAHTSVDVVDLFGIGVSSLVWSTTSPCRGISAMSYLDFTKGVKPNLLIGYTSGPSECRMDYMSSTTYQEQHRLAARLWATQAPFPVHCLSSVTKYNNLSRSYQSDTYNYHDGYFDGLEREFRGFAKVEVESSERFLSKACSAFPGKLDLADCLVNSPPTLDITWYNTGCWEESHVLQQLRRAEYHSAGDTASAYVSLLPQAVSPVPESSLETRQAYRSLHGTQLHKEVYLLDGSEKQRLPLTVQDSCSSVVLRQRATDLHPAVFMVTPRESVTLQVERQAEDVRVGHELTLEVNEWGNICKSVRVNYGRLSKNKPKDEQYTEADWEQQSVTKALCTETRYTNPLVDDSYYSPRPANETVVEILGIGQLVSPSSAEIRLVSFDLLRDTLSQPVSTNSAIKREVRNRKLTAYRSADTSKLLDVGFLEHLALPGEIYNLCLTTEPLQVFANGSGSGSWMADLSFLNKTDDQGAGYVHADPEDRSTFWKSSGQLRYLDDGQTVSNVQASFFQPTSFVDPFGNVQKIAYDKWHLHPTTTVDALGNKRSSVMDYRVMQPRLVTDENGNMTGTAFDETGAVVAQAAMGNAENLRGDTLEEFQAYFGQEVHGRLREQPLAIVRSCLSNASSVFVSDFAYLDPVEGWMPGYALTASRETSVADCAATGAESRLCVSVSYFDSEASVLQTAALSTDSQDKEQWAVSQVALFDKKKTQVRKYDAFFRDNHKFSHSVPTGVAYTTSFFDPAGRTVATWSSNATWSKTVYNAWSEEVHDAGDLLLVDNPFGDLDVGRYLSGLPTHERPAKTWYQSLMTSNKPHDVKRAQASEVYANTPTSVIYDTLGHKFRTTLHNGTSGRYSSRTFRDINGWTVKVEDTLGRIVTLNKFDMLGNIIHTASMDTGEIWTLKDSTGKLIRSRNSRGIEHRMTYDPLGRPTELWLASSDAAPVMVHKIIYGEGQANAAKNNLRGKVYQVCDQAQRLTTEAYDHLGNAIRGAQSLVKEYKAVVNWAAPGGVALEPETFAWLASHDALGRLLSKTRDDGSVVAHKYNLRGLADSIETRGTAAGNSAVVKSIEYNARGQKKVVQLGNGARSVYTYDPETALLVAKKTTTAKGQVVQDLRYALDCTNRKIRVDDDAQQTIFFRGAVVDPSREFRYDAVGRLVSASGREHLGQVKQNWVSIPASHTAGSSASASPSDGKAMSRYTEEYAYDSEGNMASLTHSLADKAVAGWTRKFDYNEPSLLEPDKRNNRLSESTVGDSRSSLRYLGPEGGGGLVTEMMGFSHMSWDFANRLQSSARQVVANGGTPETTWYRYDSNNRRVRKVTEGYAAKGTVPAKRSDHLYIHDATVEIFRRWDARGLSPRSERWSWHVKTADDKTRHALIEANNNLDDGTFQDMINLFQIQDSAASVGIELDIQGEVVSHEEYAPYGATTHRASTQLQQSKRYRFAAKERDTESGLDYVENRYYVSWLGRWLSPDPLGTADGLNVFIFVGCDPVNHTDPNGLSKDEMSDNEEDNGPSQSDSNANNNSANTSQDIIISSHSYTLPINAMLGQSAGEEEQADVINIIFKSVVKIPEDQPVARFRALHTLASVSRMWASHIRPSKARLEDTVSRNFTRRNMTNAENDMALLTNKPRNLNNFHEVLESTDLAQRVRDGKVYAVKDMTEHISNSWHLTHRGKDRAWKSFLKMELSREMRQIFRQAVSDTRKYYRSRNESH